MVLLKSNILKLLITSCDKKTKKNKNIKYYKNKTKYTYTYCFQIWGCLGKGLFDKLQNRAFRIITRENYDIQSVDILKNVGVCNLQDRRKQ